MNYLSLTLLPGWLAISAAVAVAIEIPENSLMSSSKPSIAPSVHVAVGGPQEEPNETVSMEGFWPFFRQEQQLLFLQGAWQRQQQQQRNFLSFGAGWRYFPKNHWGVGSNLFYDQETTRRQRRLGLGAEIWWRASTLTVNGYLPANGWRIAEDLKGYHQRPANGYDVTLRGVLPTLPHLGASIRYAHYWGDEVALDGAQQRYRNPKQWRWGIDVTLIPLLTLAYHRQFGLNAPSKQQISAVLSYRFSLPLSQQLDPNQVTVLHLAPGQRLASVRRDYMIALKFAKLAVPKVTATPPATIATPPPAPSNTSTEDPRTSPKAQKEMPLEASETTPPQTTEAEAEAPATIATSPPAPSNTSTEDPQTSPKAPEEIPLEASETTPPPPGGGGGGGGGATATTSGNMSMSSQSSLPLPPPPSLLLAPQSLQLPPPPSDASIEDLRMAEVARSEAPETTSGNTSVSSSQSSFSPSSSSSFLAALSNPSIKNPHIAPQNQPQVPLEILLTHPMLSRVGERSMSPSRNSGSNTWESSSSVGSFATAPSLSITENKNNSANIDGTVQREEAAPEI